MRGFIDDIARRTIDNTDFRRVLYTGPHLQLVLMSIPPGGEIGDEVHSDVDQFFRIEAGEGELTLDGARHAVRDDDAIVVPAGARHNLRNTGAAPLRLYSLYGPPEHQEGTVRHTRDDAERELEHFDGATTERAPEEA